MIYTPKAGDAQLLATSRELVREAMRVLRKSDAIVRAQSVRDELAKHNFSEDAQPQRPPED